MTPEEAREEIKRRGLPPTRAEWARQELVKRGLPTPIPQKSIGNKAYDFAQETIPYIAGGLAGAAGAPAGPEIGIPAAGLGYAGAKSGLRGIGKLLGYEKQDTLGQETKKTALQDLPAGMAMEEAAPVIGKILNSQIAKRTGKGLADMFGALPGVDTERIMAMFKKPSTLLPSFLGGPPALKEAGAAQGAIESKLGIPSLESEPIEPLYKLRPPKKVSIANPEREGIDPSKLMKNIDPKRMPELQKALAEMKGETPHETLQETAARVHKIMTAQNHIEDLPKKGVFYRGMSPEEASETIQKGKISSRSIPVPRIGEKPMSLGYTSEDPSEALFWGKTSMYKKIGQYPEKVHVGQFDGNGNLLDMMTVNQEGKILSGGPTSKNLPTIQEAVQALKGTNEALDKFPKGDMTTRQAKDKFRLTMQAGKLNKYLSESVPELQKARSDYGAASTRKAFTSPAFGLMAQSGGKDVSKMGANRLVGPFALTRMANNPAFGALLGASQSPLVLGAGTAGVGALSQAAQSPIAARAIQSLLETMRRKKPKPEGTGQ